LEIPVQITADMVRALREETGAGVMDCRRALDQAGGDAAEARKLLEKQGVAKAAKKADRAANQGLVESYIHGGGRIGVLVEVNCESDFVARNEEFKVFVRDVAMQIAAMSPKYVSRPADADGEEPEEAALLAQPFIKDPSQTIQDLLTEKIAKIGENIVIRRFERYELGK
jgi:elongation factor Ts